MDLFTEKANEIIKKLKPINAINEEKVVYSSEDEEATEAAKLTDKEEDAEMAALTPQQINAVRLATSAGGDPNDPNYKKAQKLRKNLTAVAANVLQQLSTASSQVKQSY